MTSNNAMTNKAAEFGVRAGRTTCVRIECPEWFKRADFQAFLNGRAEHGAPATWHRSGREVGGLSDVFGDMEGAWRGGEGHDLQDMPDDVWRAIAEIGRAGGEDDFTYCTGS